MREPSLAAPPDPGGIIKGNAEMEFDLEALRRAFATMPESDRAVFDRARFDGLNYEQIAAELDISLEEVERRLVAAMLHLIRMAKPPG